jgi:hypothetical protein
MISNVLDRTRRAMNAAPNWAPTIHPEVQHPGEEREAEDDQVDEE